MSNGPGRQLQAAVIGDSDPPEATLEAAERAGAILAGLSVTVVTGGLGGVMEAASRGARQAGGLVVGILPSGRLEDANPWCTVVVPTDLGHARNALTVLAADFVVAIGGGAGTLSEICFAWIHNRPIFLLEGYGGWSDRLGGAPLDHRTSRVVHVCHSLEELEAKVASHVRGLPRCRA
jgi:uncharacterized protein (TIGR00725 family)